MGSFKKIWTSYGTEVLVVILVFILSFVLQNRKFFLQNETAGFSKSEVIALEKLKSFLIESQKAQSQFILTKEKQDLMTYNHQVMLINYEMGQLVKTTQDRPTVLAQIKDLNKNLGTHFEVVNSILEQVQKSPKPVRLPASAEIEDKLNVLARSKSFAKPFYFSLDFVVYTVSVLLGLILLLSFMRIRRQLKSERQHREDSDKAHLLDTVINSLHEGLVITNSQGEFTHFNSAAQKIIGEHMKAIAVEKHVDDLGFYRVDNQELFSLNDLPMRRALEGERVEDIEIFIKNGSQPQGIYALLSSQSFSKMGGGVAGTVTVFKNISQRRATEQEWKRAREAALEASSKKSDFLAAMSHEIRTPMNGVIGMATLLGETDLTPEQHEYVQTIKKSAESLVTLINDILDHSKIEAGKVNLLNEAFNIQSIVEDAVELLRPLAIEKQIGLQLHLDRSLSWGVQGDSGRIRQVLVNLLGNAVKFTDRGQVEVQVKQSIQGTDRELYFAIKDSGPGMAEGEQKQLFQRYFQTHNGTRAGGTGLGLSICSQLVELMKGQIGVESLVGLGSTFWFKVILPQAADQEIKRLPEQSFRMQFKGRVLIAEDQVVNLRVVKSYLEKMGVEVVVAANGLQAYDRFTEQSFDLVLMDCQMPVVDGFESTRKIREYEQLHHKSPTAVIALTADIKVAGLEIYKTCGMNGHLAKPIELKNLVQVLDTHLIRSVIDDQTVNNLSKFGSGDSDLLQELVQDFEVSGKKLIKDMLSAQSQQSIEILQHAAHALKGTAGTLGALHLMSLCAKLEECTDFKVATSLIAEINRWYDHSLHELQIIISKRLAA